jgi:hypothetical protein
LVSGPPGAQLARCGQAVGESVKGRDDRSIAARSPGLLMRFVPVGYRGSIAPGAKIVESPLGYLRR